MEDEVDKDHLHFKNDSDILKEIKDEILLLSDKIIKVNRYGLSQERNIVITNKSIYNLKKKTVKRKICLNIILGITINRLSDEFIIHGVEKEYDYYYISHNRNEIIATISKAYFDLEKIQFKFAILNEKSIKAYVTTKKDKKIKSYLFKNENG
jgi:hypothetical protein